MRENKESWCRHHEGAEGLAVAEQGRLWCMLSGKRVTRQPEAAGIRVEDESQKEAHGQKGEDPRGRVFAGRLLYVPSACQRTTVVGAGAVRLPQNMRAPTANGILPSSGGERG